LDLYEEAAELSEGSQNEGLGSNFIHLLKRSFFYGCVLISHCFEKDLRAVFISSSLNAALCCINLSYFENACQFCQKV